MKSPGMKDKQFPFVALAAENRRRLESTPAQNRRNLFYSIMSAMRARDRKTQELKTPMDDLREFPFRAELLFGTSSVQPANKWVVLQVRCIQLNCLKKGVPTKTQSIFDHSNSFDEHLYPEYEQNNARKGRNEERITATRIKIGVLPYT